MTQQGQGDVARAYEPGDAKIQIIGVIRLEDGEEYKGALLTFPAGPPDMKMLAAWDGTPYRIVPTEEYARLRTLLSSSRGEQGWRTIDSAPKDGRKMLGLIGEDEVGTIWWHRDAYEGEWWMDEADSEPEPTHWMPMPPAPGSAAPQPPSVSSEIDWEHVAKNGLAKCTPEHTWAEWVADRNAENERLSGCLLAMAAATENVSAEALRSVAYDTVMNLITPDIAKHQLLCRSASPVPQNGESE